MDSMVYWLAMCDLPSFSLEDIIESMKIFESPDEFWNAEEHVLRSLADSSKLAGEIKDTRSSVNLDRYLETLNYANEKSVEIIPYIDPKYPLGLREMDKSPNTIFLQGNPDALHKKAISIVGTRNPTEYGNSKTLEIARDLAKKGYTIVSGLALGIDTQAHLGAIEGNGLTTAVLASGVANITPASNKPLANEIIKSGGAIISEYGIDTPPARYKYVHRNNITAALGLATIVIEGASNSGTRHTADFTKKMGKPILVLKPADTTSDGSALPRLLHDRGAIFIESADDVIEAISTVSKKVKTEQSTLEEHTNT